MEISLGFAHLKPVIMKANNKNLTNQRNNPAKAKKSDTSIPKTDSVKNVPKIPNSDKELIKVVQRAFPMPSVSPELTASILSKINKMNLE